MREILAASWDPMHEDAWKKNAGAPPGGAVFADREAAPVCDTDLRLNPR